MTAHRLATSSVRISYRATSSSKNYLPSQLENERLSAHMVSSGLVEPSQKPNLESSRSWCAAKCDRIAGDTIDLQAGQAIHVEPGEKVRYSNPFDEENEYFAVCTRHSISTPCTAMTISPTLKVGSASVFPSWNNCRAWTA